MKRKWIKILAAAMCIVMAVPMIGSAAPLEVNKEDCSLKVEAIKPASGSNDEMVKDLATAGIVYDLYKVADMVNDGGYYTYKITSQFAGLINNDVLNRKYERWVEQVGEEYRLVVPRDGGEINRGLWEDLAQESARLALDVPKKAGAAGTNDEDDASEEIAVQAEKGFPVVGEIIGTEKPGSGAFTPKALSGASLGSTTPEPASLGTGLYLLIARGSGIEEYITNEYIVTNSNTEAGGTDSTANNVTKEEKIVTVAYTNAHVYTFAPQLISLPTKEPDVNGVVSTANSGEWEYSPTVYLKPEQHTRYGYLEIVKDLKTYASFEGQAGEAVFVFQVEAELNGQSVYSDVKTLIFTAAGMDSVVIDKIPVGAEVKIKEVYSGASYTLEAMGQGKYGEGVKPNGGVSDIYTSVGNIAAREVTGITIEANRVASVKFTNDYDHRQTSGHGVINSYEYNEGWANRAEQEFTNPNQPQNNSQQENNNP